MPHSRSACSMIEAASDASYPSGSRWIIRCATCHTLTRLGKLTPQ
ncbi:MAG: hypothetical protein HY287_10190 [Planctomycetes bacterium]|nr:hypothetical protein [Planctomycetota bacterium]MBI3834685.1 hypothetical protein [Planctomycetota bacterium]